MVREKISDAHRKPIVVRSTSLTSEVRLFVFIRKWSPSIAHIQFQHGGEYLYEEMFRINAPMEEEPSYL